MIRIKRTPIAMMDDIYSLALWMTGSEKSANELVRSTYLKVQRNAPEREVFKTFRECFFRSIDENISGREPESSVTGEDSKVVSLRQRFADIKLSVLLSEIPGLKHRDISKIIGKPLETIRLWLSSGRQSLAHSVISLDGTLSAGHFN
ncbi:MAG: RNA polymerase subunit sigma-24 [Chlorobiaceae bacterium]|nr:RNA polymerase subunit sigma-24 [Chlorobiaceae bacterium]NTV60859.1 RNA polymerase subunit sigma-24 [Chlorobiaceae bacterium]